MASNSKARKAKASQSRVFDIVENNSQLLDLLETATSPDRKAIFICTLTKMLPDAFGHNNSKEPISLFARFTAWFGAYKQAGAIYPRISAAVQYR
jgi:hypothetical protein